MIIQTGFFEGPTPLKIGQYFEGGYVAYLTGSFPNQSGFVVSQTWVTPISPNLGYQWGVSGNDVAGASGSAIGTGKINTQYIVDYYNGTGIYSAASASQVFTSDGYSGWYLPSVDEMAQVCSVKDQLKYAYWDSSRYSWTSTQYSTSFAYWYDIRTGATCGSGRITFGKTSYLNLRPIRNFVYNGNNVYQSPQI